jgi:hypothetical protein
LVVVTAFATYRLEKAPVFAPTTGPRKVPWADVTFKVVTFAVVTKTFVVVRAFALKRFEKAPVFAPTTGPKKVPWAEETLRVETFARVETTLVVVSDARFEMEMTLSVETFANVDVTFPDKFPENPLTRLCTRPYEYRDGRVVTFGWYDPDTTPATAARGT